MNLMGITTPQPKCPKWFALLQVKKTLRCQTWKLTTRGTTPQVPRMTQVPRLLQLLVEGE